MRPYLYGGGLAACALYGFLLIAVPARPATTPNELRFAITGDPRSFDPLHSEESNSEVVRYLTAGVLVRVNRVTDQVEPELAESWSVTEGGRALSFHLRAGLRFSDNTPFSAEDVARTVTRALDPKEGSPAGDTIRASGDNPEIKVTSPRDITIRYKSPRPGLDRLFDAIGIPPANPAANGNLPTSAGAFFVSEYHRGEYLRLSRNPWYFKRDTSSRGPGATSDAGRQLPYLDSIRIDIQPNRDIELARFLRGESQLINRLDPDGFARLKKERPATARNLGPSLDSEFLWFNQAPAKTLPDWKRRWFTSTAFRHAVSRAVHREDMVRIVYGGNAHAAAGPISPANRFWFNADLRPLTADPPGALRLLSSDGFTFEAGVLRDRARHPVEFSLVTNSDNRTRQRLAQLIQTDLGKIGIRVNFVPLEFGSLIERIVKTLDYEAAVLGFSNVDLDPLEEKNVWLSSGAQHAWWPNQKSPATPWEARIDEIELRQAAEPSRDARKKAMDEMQRIVAAEEPIVYLVNPDYLCALSPSLRGAQPAVAPPQTLWNAEWLRLR